MFLRSAIVLCLLAPGISAAPDQTPPDAKQRARAVHDLGKQGSDAISKIEPYLKDPDLDVRIEAVKALTEIGTQYSLAPLIRATQDNDAEVQIRATDGLVNFYVPGYVQRGLGASLRRVGTAIKGRWTDVNDVVIAPYVQVRDDVVLALGKLARGGSAMDSRANAARAIGILRGRAALPDLYEALKAKGDDQVIYESLVAIQKIADPSAAPNITFLLRDFNEKVQLAALETTGLLRNKQALPELREALDRARNDKVRRGALAAIAMLPDDKSRELFSRYFTSKDDELRAASAEGFARLGASGDLPMIEKAFPDEKKMKPRLADAFALVSLGKLEISEFSPLQYLINTLNSKSWRGIAQAYLVELARRPEVRNSLYQALDRSTKDEKIELAKILARSGDRETIPHLEKLSRDPDTDVSEEGLRSLRTLKARVP